MELFFALLILLLITRTCGGIVEYFKHPPLIGELVAGVLIGVYVGIYPTHFHTITGLTEDEVFKSITDLGIFFLMLLGGIDLRPSKLADASRQSFTIALGGVIVPLIMGIGLGYFFLPESEAKFAQTFFIGTALAITAVPVAIKVLMDLDRLDSRAGQLIVSAAVIDDILGLGLLAILIGIVEDGTFPGWLELLLLISKIAIFFAITIIIGQFFYKKVWRFFQKFDLEEFEFSLLLVTGLGFAFLAELLDVHFILGAFMAGLFFGPQTVGEETFNNVKKQISGITTGFLAPIFFASIGMEVDFSAVVESPLFLIVFILVAVVGKLLGAGVVGYFKLNLTFREATAVGFGMSGRGAVELIVADIAYQSGLFEHPELPVVKNIFSSVVLMAILTTLMTPIILRYTIK